MFIKSYNNNFKPLKTLRFKGFFIGVFSPGKEEKNRF